MNEVQTGGNAVEEDSGVCDGDHSSRECWLMEMLDYRETRFLNVVCRYPGVRSSSVSLLFDAE